MELVAAREPVIASLPRRTVAAAIDAVLFLAGAGAAGFAAIPIAKRFGHESSSWVPGSSNPVRPRLRETRWHTPYNGVSAGLAVAGRNWRSPGMRIVGIRRVDARTHGLVSLRSAIVGTAVNALVAQLGYEYNRPILNRWDANRQAANDEMERMRESRPDADEDELIRDSLEIQRRHNVGCGPLVRRTGAQVAAVRLTALFSHRRQTLVEHAAGTVVVCDRDRVRTSLSRAAPARR